MKHKYTVSVAPELGRTFDIEVHGDHALRAVLAQYGDRVIQVLEH